MDKNDRALRLYMNQVNTFAQQNDYKSLLEFLEQIFRSNENQAANAAIAEEWGKGAKNVLPGLGFELVCRYFKAPSPKRIINHIFKWWKGLDAEEHALRLRLHPFNAIQFDLSGRHSPLKIRSGTYSSPLDRRCAGSFAEAYGLYVDLDLPDKKLSEDITEVSQYDWFSFKLRFRDAYTMHFESGRLPPARLYADLVFAIFGPTLIKAAEMLMDDERFASYPKSFPFHFCINREHFVYAYPRDDDLDDECEDEGEFDESEDDEIDDVALPFFAVDFADLEQFATGEKHRIATVVAGELSDQERIDHLLKHLDHCERYETVAELDELFALASEDEVVVKRILADAREMDLFEDGNLITLSKRIWELAPAFEAPVLEFFEELFAYRGEESTPSDPDEDPNFDRVAHDVHYLLRGRLALWRGVPDAYRERLRKTYEERIDEHLDHELPMVRLVAYETAAGIEYEHSFARTDEPGFPLSELSQLPEAYVETAVGALGLIKDRLCNRGWSILGRLASIGPRAAGAIPRVEEILNGILAREISSVRERRLVLEYLGWVLFRLGSTTIPAPIQQAFNRRRKKAGLTYLTTWKEQCTSTGSSGHVSSNANPKEKAKARMSKSSFSDWSAQRLCRHVKSNPYDVFVEIERRLLAEERDKNLIPVLELVAAEIENRLFAADGRDEMMEVFGEFEGAFLESMVLDDELEEGRTQAMQILEDRVGKLRRAIEEQSPCTLDD